MCETYCGLSTLAHQTRDVDPMLAQCWPTVCDADPVSNQHWFNASCLLITAGLVVLTAGGEMEVSAYFTSVHITIWKQKQKRGNDASEKEDIINKSILYLLTECAPCLKKKLPRAI